MPKPQEKTELHVTWKQLALALDRQRKQMIDLIKLVTEGKATIEEVAELLKQPLPVKPAPDLEVWYGPMPESNGKHNYTAILKRKGESLLSGFNITD